MPTKSSLRDKVLGEITLVGQLRNLIKEEVTRLEYENGLAKCLGMAFVVKGRKPPQLSMDGRAALLALGMIIGRV
ncbi:hypothetical protein CR513_19136, partial [Mucuna pruriens]